MPASKLVGEQQILTWPYEPTDMFISGGTAKLSIHIYSATGPPHVEIAVRSMSRDIVGMVAT